MVLLGIDFETSGLDAEKDRITEAGVTLYDSESKQPLRITGFLVKPDPVIIPSEVEKLTGITNALTTEFGVEPSTMMVVISSLAERADFFVAHNAPFDRGFYEAECKRQNLEPSKLTWIDTRTDLPHEAYARGKSASLRYLAADHGFAYPAHRAVNDVLAMLEILSRYDLDTILKRAQTPNVQVRAVVSFDERHLAKERGYYWRPETKQWVKPLKADEVDFEKDAATFPVVVMA